MGTENENSPTKRRRKNSYSQAVLNRIRLANDLRSSLHVHGKKIADRWEELLSPYLPDPERLELTTLVRAMDRLVADRLRQSQGFGTAYGGESHRAKRRCTHRGRRSRTEHRPSPPEECARRLCYRGGLKVFAVALRHAGEGRGLSSGRSRPPAVPLPATAPPPGRRQCHRS